MINHLGCSGWFYEHWKRKFYNNLPQSKWFKHYATKFDTVELNSTFYHFLKIQTAKTWYRQASKNFIYTLKANRAITHMKKFNKTKKLVKDFYKAAEQLKEKLGCILFQLPPNVHYKEKKLKEIISQLNPKYKNVLEFRHESWWNPKVYKELKKNKIIFCTVSAEGLPSDIIKTADDIYIRFHGLKWYDYDYPKRALQNYVKKIKKLKPKNLWCYFNNDSNAYAPKNCLTLKTLLEKS